MKTKQHFNRALSMLVAMLLALTLLPAVAFANDETDYEGDTSGSYKVTIDVEVDNDTSEAFLSSFIDCGSDGQIWTDKSVGYDSGKGAFWIALSALAQDYLSPAAAVGRGVEIASDVTFILDMSGSMSQASGQDIRYNSLDIYRINAMVMAVNEAVDTLMKANPDNRVAVYWYGGAITTTSNSVGTFLPLDSYSLADGTDYLLWNATTVNTVRTNPALRRGNGTVFPQVSVTTGSGTPTQMGVAYGIKNTIKQISGNAAHADIVRIPFVLLLSDGAAIDGTPRWWQPHSGGDGTEASHYRRLTPAANDIYVGQANINIGHPQIAAATILTTAHHKDMLQSAYDSYNQDNFGLEISLLGIDTNIHFYTVGLASHRAMVLPWSGNIGAATNSEFTGTFAHPNYSWALLNPSALEAVAGGGGPFPNASPYADPVTGIKPAPVPEPNVNLSYIRYAAGQTIAMIDQLASSLSVTQTGKDYGSAEAYAFVPEENYVLGNDYEEVKIIFDKLVSEAVSAGRGTAYLPVDTTNVERSAPSAITLVDILSADLVIQNGRNNEAFKLCVDGTPEGRTDSVYDSVRSSNADGIEYYSFPKYGSYVAVRVITSDYASSMGYPAEYVGRVEVRWEIGIDDFADSACFMHTHHDVHTEECNEAYPLRLLFYAEIDREFDDAAKVYYSNTEAWAEFAVRIDNPYYYIVNDFEKTGVIGALDDLNYYELDAATGEPLFDISNFYVGTPVGDTPSGIYSNVYITAGMVVASQLFEDESLHLRPDSIGTLMPGLDLSLYSGNAAFLAAFERTIFDCRIAEGDDDSDNYAFRTGVINPLFANQSPVTVMKDDDFFEGDTKIVPYVAQTVLNGSNSLVTTKLGNNGRMTLNLGIMAQASPWMLPGEIITYTITVKNFDDYPHGAQVRAPLPSTARDWMLAPEYLTMQEAGELGLNPAGQQWLTAEYEEDADGNLWIVWDIDRIPANGEVSLQFYARVHDDAQFWSGYIPKNPNEWYGPLDDPNNPDNPYPAAELYYLYAQITSVDEKPLRYPPTSDTVETRVAGILIETLLNDSLNWKRQGFEQPERIILINSQGEEFEYGVDDIPASMVYEIWYDFGDGILKNSQKELAVNELGNGYQTIDFYTLTTIADEGVGTTLQDGESSAQPLTKIYRAGEEIDLGAQPEDFFVWDTWTPGNDENSQRFGSVKNKDGKLVMPSHPLVLIASATPADPEVIVDVYVDGILWNEETFGPLPTITLKGEDGTIYDLTDELPDGSYTIIYDGKESTETVEVENGFGYGELNFYTLTTIAGTGVATTMQNGESSASPLIKVYYPGDVIDFGSLLEDDYFWNLWSSLDPDFHGKLGQNGTFTMPAKAVVIEASAKTDTEIEIEGDNSGNQDNPPGAGSQGNQGDSSNTGNQGNPPGAGSQGNPGNQDNPPGAGSQGNQGDSSHTGNQGNPPGAGSQGSQNGAPAAGNQGNAPENTKVSQPDVKGEIPSTGDSVRLWILCAITLIAAVGMLALYGKSRRPRSRRYAGA